MAIDRFLHKYGGYVILSVFVVGFFITVPTVGYCDYYEINPIHFTILPPSINITPNPAYVGDLITIKGSGFSAKPYPGDLAPVAYCNAYVYENGTLKPINLQQDGSFIIQPKVKAPGFDQIYAWDKWGNQTAKINLTVDLKPTPTPIPASTPVITSTPVPGGVPTAQPTAIPTSVPADKTVPATVLNLTGIRNGNGEYLSNVICTLTAQDNMGGSGVALIQYSFDGSTWNNYTGPFTVTQAGNNTLFYKSTDASGNAEVAQVASFAIAGAPATPVPTKTPAPSALAGIFSIVSVSLLLILARKGKIN